MHFNEILLEIKSFLSSMTLIYAEDDNGCILWMWTTNCPFDGGCFVDFCRIGVGDCL